MDMRDNFIKLALKTNEILSAENVHREPDAQLQQLIIQQKSTEASFLFDDSGKNFSMSNPLLSHETSAALKLPIITEVEPEQLLVSPEHGASLGVKLKDDEKFAKYFKMLKMHLPRGAVEQKMRVEGLDPSILDLDPEQSLTSNENETESRSETPMQRPVAQKRRTYAGKVEAAAAKAAAARSPEELLSLPQPKLILGPEPTVEMKRLWVEAAENSPTQTAESLWSGCDLKDRATRILVPSVTAQIEKSFAKSKTHGDATTGAVQVVADRQATSLISIITGPRATNLGIAASRLPSSLLDKGSLPRAILNCDSSVITDEILELLERLERHVLER